MLLPIVLRTELEPATLLLAVWRAGSNCKGWQVRNSTHSSPKTAHFARKLIYLKSSAEHQGIALRVQFRAGLEVVLGYLLLLKYHGDEGDYPEQGN